MTETQTQLSDWNRQEAIHWFQDCFSDAPEEWSDVSDETIIRDLDRLYCGGYAQFLRDGE